MSTPPAIAYNNAPSEWSELENRWRTASPDDFTLEQLEEAASRGFSKDLPMQLLKLDILVARKVCSSEDNKCDEALEFACVKPLATLLLEHDDSQLLLDAAWVVCNIASETSTFQNKKFDLELTLRAFAKHFVGTDDEALFDQVCWGLGNIVGERSDHTDLILAMSDITASMVDRWEHWATNSKKSTTLENFMWMLSSMCRPNPSTPTLIDKVAQFLPIFDASLGSTNEDLNANGLWGCAYFAQSSRKNMEALIIEVKNLPAGIHKALSSPSPMFARAGNTLITDLTQKNYSSYVLHHNLLDNFGAVLRQKLPLRKYACAVFGFGELPISVRHAAVKNASIVSGLIRCMIAPDSSQHVAILAIRNLCKEGTENDDIVDALIEHGVLDAIEEVLREEEDDDDGDESGSIRDTKDYFGHFSIVMVLSSHYAWSREQNAVVSLIHEKYPSMLRALNSASSNVEDPCREMASRILRHLL